MSELETKLENIMIEKEQKIIPENIKKDVTILGVTGTLEAGGIPTEGVKQFATIEEMNNSSGNKEGDLAVVYGSSVANLGIDTEFTKATLPDIVVLPQAFTGRAMIEFQAVDPSQRLDCWGDMDSNYMRCDFMTGNPDTDYRINYSSTDGITYTKQEGTPAEITFGYPIKYGSPWGGTQEWNDAIGYFFQVGSYDFNGLFITKNVPDTPKGIKLNSLTLTGEEIEGTDTYIFSIDIHTLEQQLINAVTYITDTYKYRYARYPYAVLYKDNIISLITSANSINDQSVVSMSPFFVNSKIQGVRSNSHNLTVVLEFQFNATSGKFINIITHNMTDYTLVGNDFKYYLTDIFNTYYFIGIMDASRNPSSGNTDFTFTPVMQYSIDNPTNTIISKDIFVNYKLKYLPAPNQLNAKPIDVYKATYYGSNGIETGTLTENVSNSFADSNAKLHSIIDDAYENMEPRILTDSDKTIDQNIYYIPTKLDGTILLNTSQVTNMQYMYSYCKNLKTIPLLDTTNTIDMQFMFNNCGSLKTIPLLNTAKVTNMYAMFNGCVNLIYLPVLDTSNVTSMQYMFSNCPNLSDESLNNILQMCINAKAYTGTKTLAYIGISQEQATKCQSLSNWNAFTTAGWTSGY